MPQRRKIPAKLQQQVRESAQGLCEYCHAAEQWQYVRFTVDHIVPISMGGTDRPDNLCLACFHCNRRKGCRITGTDPYSDQEVFLFHPREQRWNDHFIWSAEKIHIIGLTAAGRATAALLEMNRERVLHIRAADIEAGRHPPLNDRVRNF